MCRFHDVQEEMTFSYPILCFPQYDFRMKSDAGKTLIFDEIRRRWIVCTPEEWVRQNLVRFLVQDCAYPQAFVALEKQVKVADRSLRFDALIYDREINPLMLIECKAPSVKLTQKVFDQIWHYNYEVRAPFFIVTNGIDLAMGRYDASSGVEIFDRVKAFDELVR